MMMIGAHLSVAPAKEQVQPRKTGIVSFIVKNMKMW